MKSRSGFTIVELLIVIVVIGILATITIVAYNGIQTRANNMSALNEGIAWKKLFEAYKATYGSVPEVPSGVAYCLGAGFPVGGGGVPRCRDYQLTDANVSYLESSNVSLMAELSKVGNLPARAKTPINGTVGIYATFLASDIQLVMVVRGSPSDCPAPSVYSWDDGNGRLLCLLNIKK